MNNLNLSKITAFFKEFLLFIGKHRFTIVILISSLAVMLALMQTRSYLNPTRDEELYTEQSAGINYSGIDEEVVEKLQSTQSDKDIQVDADLVPDRSNPFNE